MDNFPWNTTFSPGSVWLVGAGPGDPELITVRGLQLLAEADVIFHDHLGCEELLGCAKNGATLVDVAKYPGRQTVTQDEINAGLLSAALEMKRVVRLKGGDPFVFGRGSEELDFLRAHGVICEVVPGITSAIAAPSGLGIPVTHRGVARSFAVVTARGGDAEPVSVPSADTIIWLMGVQELASIAERMMVGGRPAETPAAVIENATTHRQRSVVGSLSTIASLAAQHQIEPPAVMIVGETVRMAKEPVERKNILVTATRIPKLLRKIEPEANFIWRPMFAALQLTAFEKVSALAQLRESIAKGTLVFSNRHTVSCFAGLLFEAGLDVRAITARVGALGRESTAALRAIGLRPDFVVSAADGPTVLEKLIPHVNGGAVTLVGGAEQGSNLIEGLFAHGLDCRRLVVYNFVPNTLRPLDFKGIHEVFFAGPFAAKAFCGTYPEADLKTLSASCLGETVAQAAREVGFVRVRNIAALADDELPAVKSRVPEGH